MSEHAQHTPGLPPLWWPGVLALVCAKLALHVGTLLVTPYSVHRDELLYLAMGDRLRLFHMDFPPMIALLANATRALFGDSLFGIRALPALAGAALVLLTTLLVRELGGGRRAQVLAGFAVIAAPLFLRAAALFQPVVFDQLWWTLALLGLARIARRTTDEPAPAPDWLLLGAAGGLGLLTKFSIGFIAIGIAAAIVLTPQRRWLRTRWPWLAAALALVMGSPSIIGQINLGVPVAGQMNDLQATQLEAVEPAQFIIEQALLIGPGILLALLGVVGLLAMRGLRAFRVIGLACLATFVLLLVLRGKPYYVGPIYPALLAAGAVALETLLRGRRTAGIVVTVSAAAAMLAFMLVGLTVTLPVASPQTTARHAERLGITAAVTTNRGDVLPLPQDFADMLGWEEQVGAVARAYHALPPHDRERAVILAANYGEAGAIDHFGRRHGLPRAVAPIGSYWFFGPGGLPGDVAVGLGLEADDLAPFYADVVIIDRVANSWGVPEQQDNPISVARGPFRTLQQVWPELAGRN